MCIKREYSTAATSKVLLVLVKKTRYDINKIDNKCISRGSGHNAKHSSGGPLAGTKRQKSRPRAKRAAFDSKTFRFFVFMEHAPKRQNSKKTKRPFTLLFPFLPSLYPPFPFLPFLFLIRISVFHTTTSPKMPKNSK